MGSDINAICYAVFASDDKANISDDEFELRDGLIEITGDDFPERLDGKESGLYCYEPRNYFSFRVGSYSHYNWWRDSLCQLVHKIDARTLADQFEQYEGKAFYELICFSDCQGAIGPKTSAKLLDDFLTYQEKAEQVQEKAFFDLYKNWITAFHIAKQDGFVIFT